MWGEEESNGVKDYNAIISEVDRTTGNHCLENYL